MKQALVNQVPSVNFDAEFFVEAAVPLYNISIEEGFALDGYALSLPTKCLVFDSTTSGFAPASSSAGSISIRLARRRDADAMRRHPIPPSLQKLTAFPIKSYTKVFPWC
jgi:hypothetical protein